MMDVHDAVRHAKHRVFNYTGTPMARLACTPVTAGLFDGPKKLLFPSQQRNPPSVSSRYELGF